MIDREKLSIAVPWSLSHYIPLNGFHSLYRALFDHLPSNLTCLAWDSVALDRRLASDSDTRNMLLHKIQVEEHRREMSGLKGIEKTYQEYFWAPNHVLTSELPGDIEFHHTAPFPSLQRPFVFHCEMFATVLMPFSQQGSGPLQRPDEIREYYKRIFNDSLCLGIFSHIPETLHAISRFFNDPSIDRKLFRSRIGLSASAVSDLKFPNKPSLQSPRFLFVNSANQNPDNFFRRGGHIVLGFWKEFLGSGRDGLLMVRCARPPDQKLLEYGVDLDMVQAETGRTIIWGEDYLTNDEMNALMANAHFFLLPSMSLHSVSIMQAMTFGAIPVITDTVGTSVYVTDGENGIVLKGMREAIWYQDEVTGVLVDSYKKLPDLDDSLVSQLTSRILRILNSPETYEAIRSRTLTRAQNHLSGEAFSAEFWNKVEDLFLKYKSSCSDYQSNFIQGRGAMIGCTIQGARWSKVFESPTQPLTRINTGHSVIFEMGGAMIHANGNPSFELNDWSILAKYSSSGAPQTTFTNTLEQLNGCFLSFSGSSSGRAVSKLVGWCSRILKPYPTFHRAAAFLWKKIRRYHYKIVSKLRSPSRNAPNIELV